MNLYETSLDFPETWLPLVDTFLECSTIAAETRGMEEVTDIVATEKRGQLWISFKGGDDESDSFAQFARVLSAKICYDCGAPAERLVFGYAKCAGCT